jgi:HopA1 effector protein family
VSGGLGISTENYTKALEALDVCARSHGFEWNDKTQEGVFRRYHSDHYDAKGRKGAGVWRVYLNPHPRHVAATCSRVFALASGRQQPRRFASYGGAQGAFGELVEMVKFGEAAEAFAGRSDKVILYLGGAEAEAELLARSLATSCADLLLAAVPAMTRKVSKGVAVAAEPHDRKQRAVGTSFGEVRCALIGRALVKAATGRDWEGEELAVFVSFGDFASDSLPGVRAPVKEKSSGRPLPAGPFHPEVERLFRESNIDPDQPWL